MVNKKMIGLGKQSSAIRELFEYGKIRKQEIGEDKVFDFSIGNPNVKTPDYVNEKLIELLKTSDSVLLHGYTSATGEITTRNAIAGYLNKTFGWDASLCVSVLSIFFLVLGFIFCNKDRVSSSVASTLFLPFFIKITSNINSLFQVDTSLLLSALYCSVLVGAFVFGFQRLMYSLIILFLMSRISDKFVIGISDSKLVCIIPSKIEEVNEYLNSISFVNTFRMISKNGKDVIYCIIASKDYMMLYSNLRMIDEEVFISVSNTYETVGGLKYE